LSLWTDNVSRWRYHGERGRSRYGQWLIMIDTREYYRENTYAILYHDYSVYCVCCVYIYIYRHASKRIHTPTPCNTAIVLLYLRYLYILYILACVYYILFIRYPRLTASIRIYIRIMISENTLKVWGVCNAVLEICARDYTQQHI